MRSPSSPKARYGNGARTHDVEMQAMPVLEDTTGIWVPSGPSAVVQLQPHRNRPQNATPQHDGPKNDNQQYKPRDYKDAVGRYSDVNEEWKTRDHCIDPEDGRLAILRVQHAKGNAAPNPRHLPTPWERPLEPSTAQRWWRRLRNASTEILLWTYADALDGHSAPHKQGGTWWRATWKSIKFRYPVAAVALIPTLPFTVFEGKAHANGRYPAVRYRDYRYPEIARNTFEHNPLALNQPQQRQSNPRDTLEQSDGTTQRTTVTWVVPKDHLPILRPILDNGHRQEQYDGAFGRHTRPRYLCVRPQQGDPRGPAGKYKIVNVDDWDQREREPLDYVFVSYTRTHFQTNTKEVLDQYLSGHPTEEALREYNAKLALLAEDVRQLHAIGNAAARDAGVAGFWIDVLCMDESSVERDANRICDIVRGAKALVIAIKEPVAQRLHPEDSFAARSSTQHAAQEQDEVAARLREWGSRMWILPELLLAPNKDIHVYQSTDEGVVDECKISPIPKRMMASMIYTTDGHLVRQLIDHFDQSLVLTQTELLAIGLQALVNRRSNTKMYATADVIYALMTLARRRPPPHRDESMFVAFARLSLLNNVDRLLERLICFLPPRRGMPWYHIEDYWGVRLWDIDPRDVQVAAISGEQTVVLDGAFGAAIIWHELPRVGFLKRPNLWRTMLEYAIRFLPAWLVMAITTLKAYAEPMPSGFENVGGGDTWTVTSAVSPWVAVGVVWMVIASAMVAGLPAALRAFYRGKFWSTQALFIGIEGLVQNFDELERQLFGFSEGRLQWSTYSSTQSVHGVRTDPERLRGIVRRWAPDGSPMPPIEVEMKGWPASEDDLECAKGVKLHKYNEFHERVGTTDPPKSRRGRTKNNTASPSASALEAAEDNSMPPVAVVEPDRLFTLIDTYTMTVTAFRAVHPPSAVLVCGQEGGAQRALLCSYDYTEHTFHREAVLRMPSSVLNRMDRVEKFRFSLESMPLVR